MVEKLEGGLQAALEAESSFNEAGAGLPKAVYEDVLDARDTGLLEGRFGVDMLRRGRCGGRRTRAGLALSEQSISPEMSESRVGE